MKRFMMTAAIATLVLASGNLTAQVPAKRAKAEMAQQKKFKQIKANQLPGKVTGAIKKNFDNAKIAEAYVSENEKYKLKMKLENSAKLKTVYLDKEGKMVKNMNRKQKDLKSRQMKRR